MPATRTGTVIHGTMQETDLIPAFIDVLHDIDPKVTEALWGVDHPTPETSVLLAIWEKRGPNPEHAAALLEWLFDKLNERAPEDHYFGAHPGDRSDFGFWPVDLLD